MALRAGVRRGGGLYVGRKPDATGHAERGRMTRAQLFDLAPCRAAPTAGEASANG